MKSRSKREPSVPELGREASSEQGIKRQMLTTRRCSEHFGAEHKGRSQRQRTEDEGQVGQLRRNRDRLRRDDVASAGEQGKIEWTDDLADAVRCPP